jgi:hypothetical protein
MTTLPRHNRATTVPADSPKPKNLAPSPSSPLRIAVVVWPTAPWRECAAVWQRAERSGYTWIAQDKPDALGDGHGAVVRQLRQLEVACASLDREWGSVAKLLLTGNGDAQPLVSLDAFERCAERYRALGFTVAERRTCLQLPRVLS